ncbi:uncharacterized protein BJX67DRAFT_168809 [Aspergillus lucknowensis]|uniref:Spindle pole body formation-associated protein-domain-containing protein n=1 Tax=Aspergillus lucknowensis TaxID=176173 RepID=A0ABR4LQK4_9EURO
MLGWIGGQNDHPADESKIMEPPETPAPMFALRAFQSALFGTPKADEEDNTNSHMRSKEKAHGRQTSQESNIQKPAAQDADTKKTTKPELDLATTAITSPTKSILMTPGTASARRKTVSFGDSVVDNERKREDASTKTVKTPVTVSGNISSQWTTGSLEGRRSRLTQTLMDSREKPSRASEKSSQKLPEGRSSETDSKPASAPGDGNEDTINMNEPRSRSGKYWKAEFDSYRTKTALEIKRLIQYRSAAKTYAKKKDEEAYRLAAKLKEEELKVEEMERHVTQLASTMVAENTRADKEQLVQDLTKQTALALQYKHKVSLLRKALEQHGVVGNEVDDIAGNPEVILTSKGSSEMLQKTQQALAQANARIEEMKQQHPEFERLRGLALSSEQKASDLEKENAMLKHTLSRVKQETSKYEDRRKERETKLRQREAKLETRIREYRERLKATSQQHREQEQDLQMSFDQERRQMLEQIDVLRTKVHALEVTTEIGTRARESDGHQDLRGVQVYDFGDSSPQNETADETEEIDQPPSPSPRGKERRLYGANNDLADTDFTRAMKEMGIEDIDEKFNNLGISPLKAFRVPRYRQDIDILPSSPPEVPTTENGTWSGANNRRPHATASLPSRRLHLDDNHQLRTDRLRSRRSATKYSLDALSALPDKYLLDQPKRRQTLTTAQRESLPMERKLAAQARLKRKGETRKGLEEGKENIRTAVKN